MTKPNDFDPKAITEKQQTDIESLKSRIKDLEDKFGSHEKIADTLSDTADKQTKMQDMLTSHLVNTISGDPDVKEAIKEVVDKIDRDFVMSLVKKLGFAGWTIAVIIITALVSYYLP